MPAISTRAPPPSSTPDPVDGDEAEAEQGDGVDREPGIEQRAGRVERTALRPRRRRRPARARSSRGGQPDGLQGDARRLGRRRSRTRRVTRPTCTSLPGLTIHSSPVTATVRPSSRSGRRSGRGDPDVEDAADAQRAGIASATLPTSTARRRSRASGSVSASTRPASRRSGPVVTTTPSSRSVDARGAERGLAECGLDLADAEHHRSCDVEQGGDDCQRDILGRAGLQRRRRRRRWTTGRRRRGRRRCSRTGRGGGSSPPAPSPMSTVGPGRVDPAAIRAYGARVTVSPTGIGAGPTATSTASTPLPLT